MKLVLELRKDPVAISLGALHQSPRSMQGSPHAIVPRCRGTSGIFGVVKMARYRAIDNRF